MSRASMWMGVTVDERIAGELRLLADGGQEARLVTAATGRFVLYCDVPVDGTGANHPAHTNVIVPVPGGYPAAMIDLAGLPVGSPLLARVKGGTNPQGTHVVEGVSYQLASYHPHTNGGGPPWDPRKHGFHTYLDHLLSWLTVLN